MTHHDLMHGLDYTGQPLDGWLVQEKLDGVRCLWTGSELVSRNGSRFDAPAWFTIGLPQGVPLDGELYAGKGRLGIAAGTARTLNGGEKWRALRFVVFDAPGVHGGYVARHAAARTLTASAPFARVGKLWRVKPDALAASLARLQADGGEGFILREPRAGYAPGRTAAVLKFKTVPRFLASTFIACQPAGSASTTAAQVNKSNNFLVP